MSVLIGERTYMTESSVVRSDAIYFALFHWGTAALGHASTTDTSNPPLFGNCVIGLIDGR
jgi:hypothetical protein